MQSHWFGKKRFSVLNLSTQSMAKFMLEISEGLAKKNLLHQAHAGCFYLQPGDLQNI